MPNKPMETLTEDQALELARAFKASALSLGQFTIDHWKDITPADRDRLNGIEWSLFNASEDCINLAGILIMDKLKTVLQKIGKATEDAQDAIKKISIVKKAISIAAAVLTLASAIMSRNPGAILDALTPLVDEIKKLPHPSVTASS